MGLPLKNVGELVGEVLKPQGKPVDAGGKTVVGNDCRYGGKQANGGCHKGLCNTGATLASVAC